MANIFDVAREAQVSIASVSLVLKDPETPRVGKVKRAEILRVAKEMGYSPNLLTRGLGKHGTNILGLVVPTVDAKAFFNLTISEILAGIQACLSERRYHLMVYSHAPGRGKITETEIVQSRTADGLIFINTRNCTATDVRRTVDELSGARVPFVMINSAQDIDGINYVGVDERALGVAAGNYLVKQGHEHIAMIAGTAKSPTTEFLREGFAQALKAHARKFPARFLAHGAFRAEDTAAAVEQVLRGEPRPTAIFCATDLMVPDVYAALRQHRLRIPRDMAVLGRGDLMFAPFLEPALTTFRFPFFDIGYESAATLISSIKSGSQATKKILLPAPLIERRSV